MNGDPHGVWKCLNPGWGAPTCILSGDLILGRTRCKTLVLSVCPAGSDTRHEMWRAQSTQPQHPAQTQLATQSSLVTTSPTRSTTSHPITRTHSRFHLSPLAMRSLVTTIALLLLSKPHRMVLSLDQQR